MNVEIRTPMWIQALRVIPRITGEEWDRLGVFTRWLIACRSAVLVMTFLSCAIGVLLALRDGPVSPVAAVICLIGLILAHAANNLLNDIVDFRKGVDTDNYYRSLYGPQALEHGLLSPRQMFGYAGVTALIAFLCGVYLTWQTGPRTLIFFGLGAFFLLFYTWPLKYIGLGEFTVIAVWGPLMIGGTYFVVTGGGWRWDIVWTSLAYALGPASVLFGKHIDKLEDDRARRIRTFPVIIGEKAARGTVMFFCFLQYLILVLLIVAGKIGLSAALTLFAFPKLIWALKYFSRPRPKAPPPELPPNTWPLYFSAVAFVYNRRFGALFLLGLLLDLILIKAGFAVH
jgi:1,4-dihydroxy-2-naphthoate octaprenyltransferase